MLELFEIICWSLLFFLSLVIFVLGCLKPVNDDYMDPPGTWLKPEDKW